MAAAFSELTELRWNALLFRGHSGIGNSPGPRLSHASRTSAMGGKRTLVRPCLASAKGQRAIPAQATHRTLPVAMVQDICRWLSERCRRSARVRRRDKEIIEIGECAPLAFVIDRLQAFRSGLAEDSEAEVKLGGDDCFGWRLTVTFFRELTTEEAALEARYSPPFFGRGSRDQAAKDAHG